jgi:signal peptidase I
MNIGKSKFSAFLMNLILPGLGHVYWKEYIFGLFIFLIMLVAALLVVVSFFIEIPFYGYILILILPAIFYIFTFIDLNKTIDKKNDLKRGTKTAFIFLIAGLLFQLTVPLTPANFAIRNAPEIIIVKNNSMSPMYRQGDITKSSSIAYYLNLFFYDEPIIHHIPYRFDLVRFIDSNGRKANGLVIGLPNENIEMFDGILAVNNIPINEDPPGGLFLSGYCELTTVHQTSILVATLNLGTVDKIYQVSLGDVKGKIEKLF